MVTIWSRLKLEEVIMGAGTVDVSAAKGRIVAVDYGERSAGNWVARSFTYADFAVTTNTLDLIDLPANSFIAEMYLVIKTAFNAGSSNALAIGDTASAEYILTAGIDESSTALVGDLKAVDSLAAYALKGARPFYADATSHIQVTYTFTGTAPSAGEACVIACIVEVPSY